MTGKIAKGIQFFADSRCDDIPLAYRCRRIRAHRAAEGIQQVRASVEGPCHPFQRCHIMAPADSADGVSLFKAALELHDFAGRNFPCRSPGYDSLKVPDVTDEFLQLLQVFAVSDEMLHHIIAGIELVKVHHRHCQPCAQKPCPHRRGTFVNDRHKGYPFTSCRRREYLQIAECELVHPHEFPFVNPGYGTDVPESRVLSLLQIDEERSGRSHAEREALYAESLQRVHP